MYLVRFVNRFGHIAHPEIVVKTRENADVEAYNHFHEKDENTLNTVEIYELCARFHAEVHIEVREEPIYTPPPA